MEGYEVITSDEHKLGHVVGTIGDNLVVEHGTIIKSKHPVPKAFAEAHDDEKVVRLTVSKEIVTEAPKVNGDGYDEQAVAEHYGLAPAFEEPETEGYGEVLPGATARQQTTSPGLLGDRTPES